MANRIKGEVRGDVDVSVVIPTYNRSTLLRDAVQSVLDQDTQAPFEIVIVDNNSQDDTESVARALVEKHPQNIQYVRETEQGNAHARNRGVRTARGAIVAFIDDDVAVESDWLTTLLRALDSQPGLSFVGGRVLPQWSGPPPSWLTPDHWSPLALLDYGPDEFVIAGDSPRGLLTANIAFRRDVFDDVGWFSPHLQRVKNIIGSMEDTEFLMRVCRSGRKGLYLPQMIARAPVEPERLSKTYHRRWHTGQGHFYAVMRDPEWERSRFSLAGVPSHLYKQTLTHGLGWLKTIVTGNTDAAFTHECQLRFFRGFYRARAHQRRPQTTQT
ncbi:MAG TPA: glycosyltransferase family A protein [Pyrinomonadaceae bacterium]|nr:glycosyltransferase family A protein [Pyrinomonadaceae bacterium]